MTLTSSVRQTGLDPTSAQATSLSEIDSIDVFDFFNYPKVAESMGRTPYSQTSLLHSQIMDGMMGNDPRDGRAVPDPSSDWLQIRGNYN